MPHMIEKNRGEQQDGKQRSERTELGSLYLEGAFEGCRITDFRMRIAPGEHAGAWIQGRLDLAAAREWMYRKLEGSRVTVRGPEDEILFCGIAREASMDVLGEECRVGLELVSGSCLLDLRKESASYQDQSLTYRQIMKEIIREVDGGSMIFPGIEDRPTGQPVIRYLETAWEILGRLASHSGVPLVADVNTTGEARVFAGIPKLNLRPVVWEDADIVCSCQDGRYLEAGGPESGLSPFQFMRYDVEVFRNLRVGQKGEIKNRKVQVIGVDAASWDGEVVFLCHIAAEGYCYTPKKYNRKLSGMSLLGTVIKRDREDIWLHLDIDGGRASADNWEWPWTPPTGNFMYLMPKIGSRVSLYFGSEDERSGKGINCIAQGGGNPEDRWLKTEHKKSMNLTRKELSLVSENGGNSIRFSGNMVNLEGNRISCSARNIKIEGKGIIIQSRDKNIKIGCGAYEAGPEAGSIQQDPNVYLGMDGEDWDIIGQGSTKILAESSGMTYPPYPDGPEEGRFNWQKSVLNTAVAVVVVGGTAVFVCSTMGGSLPVVAGAATTALLAGGGVAANDFMSGSVGSMGDAFMAVGGAELMFLTNLAATKIIAMAGMGYTSGVLVQGVSMAGAEAGLDLLVEGEINYNRLAENLAINVVVDLLMGPFISNVGDARTVEGGSGAASVHQGKFYAESNDISYESIMRALRKSDTKEGYAVAALLKRGKIELRIANAHPKGYGGLYKFGTNYITIYKSAFNTPLSAAGYATHETRHYLQNLSSSSYAKIHEFEAFSWQRNVDKSFGLRLDREIWDLINTHPAYKNLKPY